MLYNYFKIALRNLMRRKGMTFINIFGLALGMACCMLLLPAIREELSYDNFHANKDRIFRVYHQEQTINGEGKYTSQPLAFSPTLKSEVSEIQYASRVNSANPTAVKYNGTLFRESPSFVDADFFRMFSFQFLQGSPDAALNDISAVVVTKSIADKMFGENANALGKQITVLIGGETKPFTITGVIENPPNASSIELFVVVRYENIPGYQEQMRHWDNVSTEVYVCLKNGITQGIAERAMVPLVASHYAEIIKQKKDLGVKSAADGSYITKRLQPLSDVHFGTVLNPSRNGKDNVYMIAAIAIFIMLIASINFINLSLARSFLRSREVGIRKTIGASRQQLVVQFLGEALLVVLFALFLSVVIAEILLPAYNSAVNAKHTLLIKHGSEIALAENLFFWGAVLVMFLVIGVGAGAYPAFYVSGLQAASTLKSNAQKVSPSRLRNILVIVQFTLAVGLITCTLVMQQQTDFMQQKPLGYNRDYVLMIPTGDGAHGREILEKFRSLVGANPNVLSMSSATKPVGRGLDGSNTSSVSLWNFNGGEVGGEVLGVNVGYIEAMQIPMLAGRTFDKFHSADTSESIVVNEMSARQIWNLLPETERKRRAQNGEFSPSAVLGVQIPVNEPNVKPGDADYHEPLTVIGVTANYHYESLRREIKPALHVAWLNYPASYIFVRIRSENAPATVAMLETAWKTAAPDTPWIGSFIDENIERMYRNQWRMTKIAMSAASIAIALSCMGLFALAAIIITQRTKEIGIRKVLGASVSGIIGLLTKDFLKLVGIAILVALPLAWYGMNAWLQDFAYKIDLRSVLGAVIFIAAGLAAVAIAFLTIAFQAFRAAKANPVEALKSE